MIPQSSRTAPPKPQKGTRAKEKARAARLTVTERKRVYALVDLREGGLCRFTRWSGWLEHHHIKARSQGGAHTTGNVVLIHKTIHDGLHNKWYRIDGHDADGPLRLINCKTGREVSDF